MCHVLSLSMWGYIKKSRNCWRWYYLMLQLQGLMREIALSSVSETDHSCICCRSVPNRNCPCCLFPVFFTPFLPRIRSNVAVPGLEFLGKGGVLRQRQKHAPFSFICFLAWFEAHTSGVLCNLCSLDSAQLISPKNRFCVSYCMLDLVSRFWVDR